MWQHPEEGTLVTAQHPGTLHAPEWVHKLLVHTNPCKSSKGTD